MTDTAPSVGSRNPVDEHWLSEPSVGTSTMTTGVYRCSCGDTHILAGNARMRPAILDAAASESEAT